MIQQQATTPLKYLPNCSFGEKMKNKAIKSPTMSQILTIIFVKLFIFVFSTCSTSPINFYILSNTRHILGYSVVFSIIVYLTSEIFLFMILFRYSIPKIYICKQYIIVLGIILYYGHLLRIELRTTIDYPNKICFDKYTLPKFG